MNDSKDEVANLLPRMTNLAIAQKRKSDAVVTASLSFVTQVMKIVTRLCAAAREVL
jgi:hypothetical protein